MHTWSKCWVVDNRKKVTGCLMKNMSPFYTEGDILDSATLRLSPQMVKIISSYPPQEKFDKSCLFAKFFQCRQIYQV